MVAVRRRWVTWRVGWLGPCGPRACRASVELERLAGSCLCALEGAVADGNALKAMVDQTHDQTHVRFCERFPDDCFGNQERVFPVSFERGSLV